MKARAAATATATTSIVSWRERESEKNERVGRRVRELERESE